MAVKYRYDITRRVSDKIVSWLIKRDRAPQHYYLLTTTGRKTGLPRTHPVALVEHGDQKWLVAPYGAVGWVHNARAAGQVILSRGAYQQAFTVSELPAAERPPFLKEYITLFPITRQYFDAKYTDPPEAFSAEAGWRLVFSLHPISL